jgi:hypothetical protein
MYTQFDFHRRILLNKEGGRSFQNEIAMHPPLFCAPLRSSPACAGLPLPPISHNTRCTGTPRVSGIRVSIPAIIITLALCQNLRMILKKLLRASLKLLTIFSKILDNL